MLLLDGAMPGLILGKKKAASPFKGSRKSVYRLDQAPMISLCHKVEISIPKTGCRAPLTHHTVATSHHMTHFDVAIGLSLRPIPS